MKINLEVVSGSCNKVNFIGDIDRLGSQYAPLAEGPLRTMNKCRGREAI